MGNRIVQATLIILLDAPLVLSAIGAVRVEESGRGFRAFASASPRPDGMRLWCGR
jgi:hypothetical protein